MVIAMSPDSGIASMGGLRTATKERDAHLL